MRRTVALIALLATSWPHAVVLECALASAAAMGGGEARHHVLHGGGGGHGDVPHGDVPHALPPTSIADGESGAATGGHDCARVMACGVVMLRAGGGATTGPAAPTSDTRSLPSVDLPTAADPVTDPPPPRRHA